MTSLMNPGISMNFDAKALEEQDEQEQQKEDLKREQELRDLLTNELPDDLLDDCSSLSSHDSSGFESPTTKSSRHQIWQQFGWHHHVKPDQTSTPVESGAPLTLKTPAPTRDRDYRLQQAETPDHYEESDTESGDLSRQNQNGYHDNHHYGNNYTHHHGQHNEYANEPHLNGVDSNQPELLHQFHYRPTQEHFEHQQIKDGIHANKNNNGMRHSEWSGDNGKNVDTWVKNGQYYQTQNEVSDGFPRQDANTYTSMPQHVQYRPHPDAKDNFQENYGCNGQDHSDSGEIKSLKEEEIRLQQFMHQGGSSDSRHLGQLQILYKARGRELEELRQQLKQVTEEGARETRVLNHQLALSDGEKSALTLELEQNKEHLKQCIHDSNNLKMTVKTYEQDIQELLGSKQQLTNQLEDLSANNEALNHQLIQLNQSETISRSRDQHDMRLAELQRRQQEAVFEFESKLDKLNAELREKESELSSQRDEIAQLRKDHNREKVDMTETVSVLTRQLEESQRQCRDLLDTGSVQEIGQLKLQLQHTTSSKCMAENMCQALQDELADIKEELRMYEAAACLGVGPSKSPNGLVNTVDSYIQLGVRNLAKEDWKTPKVFQNGSSKVLASDDLVSGLKTELERSLNSNRSKRGQVIQLQNELKTVNEDLAKIKTKMAEMENELKDKEVKLRVFESQDKSSVQEGNRGQTEGLRSELIYSKEHSAQLQVENKELKMSLKELQEKEEALSQKNLELKNQMSEMIAQHDEDSKVAVERTRATVLQLHEDSSKNLRQEMIREWEEEKATLEEAYEHRLQQLKEENGRILKELDEVKGLYVKVCEEKNEIEDTVRTNMTDNAHKQLTKAIEVLEKQHEEKLANLKNSLETQQRVALTTARKKIMEEKEEEIEKLVEEKVSIAKAEWMITAQKQARETATKAVEAEWEARLNAEVIRRLDDKVNQVKENLMEEYQQKLSNERDSLKATHSAEQDMAVTTALSRAKLEWQSEQETTLKELVTESLQRERENSLEPEIQKRIDTAVLAAKEQWSKQETNNHSYDSVDSSKWLSQLQSSWKKEMESLEKQKDEEKQDALEELRKHNESLKMTLEQQKSVLSEALKSARDAFEKEKTKILKQKDLEHSIAEAKFKTKILEEWSANKREAIQEKVLEEQIKWQKEKQELEENFTEQVNAIEKDKERVMAKQDELIEEAVSKAKKGWHEKYNDESRKADQALETWEEEKHNFLTKLEELEEKKQNLEEKVDSYKRKFTREHNRLVEKSLMERQRLQRKLKLTEKELEQTEYTLKKELEHLKDQLKNEGSVAMETMQAKMAELQRRHTVAMETLEKKHAQDRKRWCLEQVKTPTNNTSHDATDGLQELRAHYLATVNKIKDDVLVHVEKTREHCRETVRKEVIKERHATAKKLRKYYLQCLQQLLDEDRQGARNGTGTMLSTANKLAAMASALELSPERTSGSNLNITEGVTLRSVDESKVKNAKCEQNAEVVSLSEKQPPKMDLMKHWSSESSLCNFLDTDSESNYRRSDPTDSRGSIKNNWQEEKLGSSLESLSMSPREFNPMPEKPMSVSPQRAISSETFKPYTSRNAHHTDNSKSVGNITVRARQPIYKQGHSSDIKSNVIDNERVTIQSKNCDNQHISPINASQPSRYANNVSTRNPVHIPDQSDRTKILLESMKQAGKTTQMKFTRQIQVPMNLSNLSVTTEYNDLPESLDSSFSSKEKRGSGRDNPNFPVSIRSLNK
ncbi:centrosomal protein of 152 kDa-like isoform X3 [Anneissia japonica]|uniref:centrosomal protein of 152 kDa-like isoform X3 n=1 Tax=Anneissia japonica TaxID=1529436 RepID=UPI00142557C4|nr:centrosomal protein of 152 kDa-like isoform X3 [Anneissia japonica]